MKTISIINNKGGVAKTTTTLNLAYELTKNFGKKVIVIDLDPSGNLSQNLRQDEEPQITIANVLMGGANIKSAITKTKYENLDIIQAGKSLEIVNKELEKAGSTEILRDAIISIQDDYDYCIIDNAPAITKATENGLVASNEVLVPMCVDAYSIFGLGRIAEAIQEARKINPTLYFLGVLITRYQKNNDEDVKKVETDIYSQKQFPVISTKIRTSPKAAGSNVNLKIVTETSKRSSTAIDYHKVATDYLSGKLREI